MNYGLGKIFFWQNVIIIDHDYIDLSFYLALSLKLEKFLAQLLSEGAEDSADECLEDRAMIMAQEEIFEETGRQFKPWCANGKSVRMGEIILIIDSDTIVPEDCFRDAAREMGESPDVAIIQHESGMNPPSFFLLLNDDIFFSPQTLCKLPTIISKTVSHTLLVVSTNVSLLAVLMAKLLPSLDTMLSFVGLRYKMRLSLMQRIINGNSGRKRMFPKISIWR